MRLLRSQRKEERGRKKKTRKKTIGKMTAIAADERKKSHNVFMLMLLFLSFCHTKYRHVSIFCNNCLHITFKIYKENKFKRIHNHSLHFVEERNSCSELLIYL